MLFISPWMRVFIITTEGKLNIFMLLAKSFQMVCWMQMQQGNITRKCNMKFVKTKSKRWFIQCLAVSAKRIYVHINFVNATFTRHQIIVKAVSYRHLVVKLRYYYQYFHNKDIISPGHSKFLITTLIVPIFEGKIYLYITLRVHIM